MEFRDIFISALIIGLFVYLIVLFASSFSIENDAPVSVTDNPFVEKMYGNVSVQLNQSSAQAESAKTAFIQEGNNPITTALGFVFTSILYAGNLFMGMIINMFSAIFIFAGEFLGINALVLGVLLAILTGIIVLAIWSVIRAGR